MGKSIKRVVLLMAMILLFGSLTEARAGCRLSETADDSGEVSVTMENSFLKLVFEPSHGGRCSSLILKGNKDLVWWGPPKEIYGGVFEDHFWQQGYPGDYTDRQYKYEIVSDTLEKVSLMLFSIGESGIFKGVRIEKTISIYKDKTYIDADYKIKNVMPTATARSLRFGFWAHHILRAGGPGMAEKNTFYAPTINGIKATKYDPANPPNCHVWEYEPTRGWSAVAGESGEGIACLFDYKYLKCFYFCLYGSDLPTLEWRYNLVEVRPEESFNTRIRLIPFKGLSSIEGAGDVLVGSIKTDKERYEKNEPISINLTLNSAETKDIVLKTDYRILPSEDFSKLESKKVSLLVNTPKKTSFNLKPEKEGTYIIRCLAKVDNKVIADFFKPVVIGKDTGSFKLAAKEKRITIKDTFEDLVPEEWRPVTKPVETPHIKWAKPYAKERPKVLFLTAEDYQRELTELAQRMDIEYDFIPLKGMYEGIHGPVNKQRFKFIEEKLCNEYDVIFSSNLFFEEFPEGIQKAIVKKVAEGTGFVSIVPSKETKILSEILPFSNRLSGYRGATRPTPSRWHKKKEHFVTTGIPFSVLPKSSYYRFKKLQGEILVSAGNDPLLSINEYKKGRVAALSYFSRQSFPITPTVDHYEVEFDYWEYYYSLIAKSILWAGKKEPNLEILSLKPEGEELKRENNSWIIRKGNIISYSDEKPAIKIKLQCKEDIKGTVHLVIKNKRYETVKKHKEKLNIKKNTPKDIAFEIPEYLETGLYLADIFLKDKQDRILNWGTAHFKVISNIELTEIKTDKKYYKKPEDKKNISVTLKINNKERENKDVSLNVELSDALRRLIITKSLKQLLTPGINRINLTLHSESLITPIHKLKIILSDNTGILLTGTSPVYTPKEPDEGFSDYSVFLWFNFQPHYLHPYFYQLAKGIGIGGMAGAYYKDSFLRIVGENNFWMHYENMPWLGCKKYTKLETGGYIRHYKTLSTHPEFKGEKNFVKNEAERLRKFNILFYSLGEENALTPVFGGKIDVCFCKHCQKAFRQWLEKEYKTLEALNAQWDTSYDSWEKVVPISWEKANKNNPSQWIDFRTFMEDEVWIEGIKEFADEIIKQDPGAYVGINASSPLEDTEYPFKGWNYAKLYKYDRAGILYDKGKLKLELLRSLKNHKTFVVKGYGYTEAIIKYITWKYVLHGACGASYFKFASSDVNFGYQWMLHPNMCYCRRSMIVKEAVEDLTKGVGKILINTPRYKEDEIGILYFRPSMYRSWIEDSIADGPSYNSYFSSIKGFPSIIESLQLQYNFIIEEQALRGELNKYKVVFLPYMVSASPEILAKIDEFVKQGGVVIANMRLASCDIHGKEADYSSFLKRVFGISREERKYSFDLGSISRVKEFHGITPPKKLRVVGKEKIESTSSEVIAKYKDNTPAITMNKYGKGYGIYLNFVPKTDVKTKRVIEKMLTLGGVKREIKLTGEKIIKGKTREVEVGYETFRWKKGDIEYVGILRPSGGLDKSQKVCVSLPYQAHIYDVREKKYLGFVQEPFSYFNSPDYKIFALLPYEVEGINLSLKPVYKQGESLKYRVKINGNGKLGDHTLRIEVYGPDNKLSEAYTKNVIAEAGKYESIIPLALNEKEGEWKIKVIDVISGKIVEKKFVVR